MKLTVIWLIALIVGFTMGRISVQVIESAKPVSEKVKASPGARTSSSVADSDKAKTKAEPSDDLGVIEAEIARMYGLKKVDRSSLTKLWEKLSTKDFPRALLLARRFSSKLNHGEAGTLGDCLQAWDKTHPGYALGLLEHPPAERGLDELIKKGLSIMTASDPRTAWRLAHSLKSRFQDWEGNTLVKNVAEEWANLRPSEAVEFARALRDPLERARFIRIALPQFLVQHPKDFANWLKRQPDAEELRGSLTYVGSLLDPFASSTEAPLRDLFEVLPGLLEKPEDLRSFFVQFWSEPEFGKDSDSWLAKISDPVVRDVALSSLAQWVLRTDDKRAEALVAQISDSETRRELTAEIIAKDADEKPEQAWARAVSLAPRDGRAQAMAEVFERGVSNDPFSSSKFLHAHMGEFDDEAIIRMLRGSRVSELMTVPEFAAPLAKVAMHASTSATRLQAMEGLLNLNSMDAFTPAIVRSLLTEMPSDAARETAIAALVGRGDVWNPDLFQQAVDLRDPVLREEAVKHGVERWMSNDLPAARRWLMTQSASVLPADVLQSLRDQANGKQASPLKFRTMNAPSVNGRQVIVYY